MQEQVNAANAFIRLKNYAGIVTLVISDDGEGCQIDQQQQSVGIRSIMSRPDLYGGSVTVASSPGNAYELRVVLPVGLHNDVSRLHIVSGS